LKIKYNYKKFTPNCLDKENIDRLAVEKIPENSKVLDVGCATGFMGEYLIREKKCLVYGVDKRVAEANIAKKILTGAIIADVEQGSSVKRMLDLAKGEKFDVILATSIIEHLKDPSGFLKNCKKLLKQNGIVVASTPNIAHWTMRLSLLKGNFDYTEYGILDNTHLHFFTVKTFRQLFEDNNFTVKELLIDPVGGGYPRISRILAKLFPKMFAYQILIIAQNKK
jgi:O-antigen biosynthesis protein